MRLIPARRAVSDHAAVVMLWMFGLAGCGVLGSPIPPEDVGVAPVIERQLRREGLLSPGSNVWGSASRPNAPAGIRIEESPIPPEPDPLLTPPLREMGTR